MFERFTDRARRVVVLAQEEARLLNHNYIGTEHILLGLIHEGEGVAAKALESLGISLENVRNQVEEIIGEGGSAPSGSIPFTPRSKKVMELALREALQLGNNWVGTEHLLLGLIREGEGIAAQVLVSLGGSLDMVRRAVINILKGTQEKEPGTPEPAEEESDNGQWWLIDYRGSDGVGRTAVLRSNKVQQDIPGFLSFDGGHHFSIAAVSTVFAIDGPGDWNQTHTPSAWTAHDPFEDPHVVPVGRPKTRKETEQEIRDAIDHARSLADNKREKEEEQMKRWGGGMATAIAQARESMDAAAAAGGIIYIPTDGSAPSYVAPDKVAMESLARLFRIIEADVQEEDE